MRNIPTYSEVNKLIDFYVFEIFGDKLQFSWPRCQATVVAMATNLCTNSWGSSPCQPLTMKLISPPTTELLQFYLNRLRHLVTLTFDLLTLESRHVMPFG